MRWSFQLYIAVSKIGEGLALSSQWAIHSSGQGVYVLPLTSGWLAQSFTWARRVL
jgi:hypothetical protein